MIVYASMQYLEDDFEWINLVLGENGEPVMCKTYATEAECRYEMIEETKVRLNEFYSKNGLSIDYCTKCADNDTLYNYIFNRMCE